MNAIVDTVLGLIIALVLASTFGAGAIFFGATGLTAAFLLDAIIIFLASYMLQTFMDKGLDRALFVSFIGALFVAIVTTFANQSTAVGNVFTTVFTPAIMSVFFGVLIAELILEYAGMKK